MAFSEQSAIDQIATYERAIDGIRNSYGFARNPDRLNNSDLPAVLHFSPGFTASVRGHFNLWDNVINVTSILCVSPREAQGGKLRYLENEAVVYGGKWRSKFQDQDVVKALLGQLGATGAFLTGGNYGAGGALLNVGGIDYIGWIFNFQIENA